MLGDRSEDFARRNGTGGARSASRARAGRGAQLAVARKAQAAGELIRDAERALVLKDYATRARQQTGATLYGTVHCELLDYYTTIELQKHFAQLHLGAPPPPPLQREDVEDIAKGYGVDALIIHRPEITLERVVAHARDVYLSLRKAAAQRSAPLCRPREDGEAFDPAVHIWDVGATRLDWAEKYEAAYGGAPPRIERYSDKVKAQEALEERERLSGAAIRDKRAKLYFIGEREACTRGCGAMVWPGEASLCCRGGKHILGPAFNPPIDETYLTIAKKPGFSADSRRLNDKLAFATLCTSPSRSQGGLGIFVEKGGVCVLFGRTIITLMDPNAGPSGLDGYRVGERFLYDGACADYGESFAQLLIELRAYLIAHHPFAQRLPRIADLPGPRINVDSLIRIEAHSAPTGKMEIAEVSSGVPGAESNVVVYFDMSRSRKGIDPKPVHVSPRNALFEVLQWPLLFPEGIGGYFFKSKIDTARVRSTEGNELTLQDYTKCMLMQNMRMAYAGRAMQEWLLAMHSRQVEQQMSYLRNPALQAKIVRREDKRKADGGKGEKVRMPSSVVGSKAYLSALMEDTLAVTSAYGKSTLFVTLTCNPKWKEIQDALEAGQDWTDRPDVVCRVFKLKLQEFMHDLRKGTFFKDKIGRAWGSKYTLHVIEFQKRGLPHAHILVRLDGDEADIPKRGVDVDRIIQAHMPPLVHGHSAGCDCDDHRLRRLVQEHMCHRCVKGMCFSEEDPRCKRRYPKDTNVEETTADESGYPLYRRTCREDEFVVPYNRIALLKYETHVNFELVSTAWVIKYVVRWYSEARYS